MIATDGYCSLHQNKPPSGDARRNDRGNGRPIEHFLRRCVSGCSDKASRFAIRAHAELFITVLFAATTHPQVRELVQFAHCQASHFKPHLWKRACLLHAIFLLLKGTAVGLMPPHLVSQSSHHSNFFFVIVNDKQMQQRSDVQCSEKTVLK